MKWRIVEHENGNYCIECQIWFRVERKQLMLILGRVKSNIFGNSVGFRYCSYACELVELATQFAVKNSGAICLNNRIRLIALFAEGSSREVCPSGRRRGRSGCNSRRRFISADVREIFTQCSVCGNELVISCWLTWRFVWFDYWINCCALIYLTSFPINICWYRLNVIGLAQTTIRPQLEIGLNYSVDFVCYFSVFFFLDKYFYGWCSNRFEFARELDQIFFVFDLRILHCSMLSTGVSTLNWSEWDTSAHRSIDDNSIL